ncbi:MAG: cell wall metabolism sensor histidine kinase WalK [Actinomycetia bacterium]|nr:cell wall metabolism sensor histidine kinase WalK [Actinomycetes bacterium]
MKTSVYRLFLGLAFATAIVIILLGIVGTRTILNNFVVREAENNANAFSMALSSHVMKDALERTPTEGEDWVLSKDRSLEVDNQARQFLAPFDIVKIKIFNMQNRIIYSTDPTVIGDVDKDNKALATALAGTPYSKYETEDEVWDLENEMRHDVAVVETYTPMRNQEGTIIGAFEIYKDVTSYQESIRSMVLITAGMLLAIIVPAFAVLILLMRRAITRHDRLETRERDLRIELEKAKVYEAMLSAAHHVLNNFLNKMQLFKLTAENTADFDRDVLSLYDEVINTASEQIEALGSIATIDEKSIGESVAPKPSAEPNAQ